MITMPSPTSAARPNTRAVRFSSNLLRVNTARATVEAVAGGGFVRLENTTGVVLEHVLMSVEPGSAPLAGTMLVITNEDQPGVIGEVGTLLGRHGVNIASFALGIMMRESVRGYVSAYDAASGKPRMEIAQSGQCRFI